MIYEEDFELAARLRRIAAEPKPIAPSGVYSYVDRVAAGEIAAPEKAWPSRSGNGIALRIRSRATAVVGIAATFVLAVSATLLLTAGQRGAPAATPRSTDLWSALEWHDITATAFPPTTTATGANSILRVANRGGETYATTSLGGPLWASTDGMNWRQVSGAPSLDDLLATPDFLLGQASPQPQCGTQDSSGAVETATCAEPSALWYSHDGHTWSRSSLQLPAGHIVVSWAAVGSAVVVLAATQDLHTPLPAAVSSKIYLSTDGADWKQVTPPAAMAGALSCVVTATRAGFVFTGGVADPAGEEIMSGSIQEVPGTSVPPVMPTPGADQTYSVKGYWKSWVSSDGSTWTSFSPTQTNSGLNSTTFGPIQTISGSMDGQLVSVLQGSRGDVFAPFMFSADGVRWSFELPPTGQPYFYSFSSNGSQIVGLSDGAVFGVTLGDGRWQQIQNVGSVANLPSNGEPLALPGGVLYDAGGHVYFGRAITGATPTGQPTGTPSAGS